VTRGMSCACIAGAVGLLFLCGCEVVDRNVLETARVYWPQAELFHPRRDTVLIETHMSGISGQFAAKTFKAMLAENGRELREAFLVSGYTILILGFDGYHVVWSLQRERYVVLDQNQYFRLYQGLFHTLPMETQ